MSCRALLSKLVMAGTTVAKIQLLSRSRTKCKLPLAVSPLSAGMVVWTRPLLAQPHRDRIAISITNLDLPSKVLSGRVDLLL